MSNIKIAFFKGRGSWYSALIRWWTNGPYSHTETIISDETNSAGAHLCYSSEIVDNGVRAKWVMLSASDWDIVEIDADPISIKNWFDTRMGASYDILGLIGFVYRTANYERDKYFCSEATAASLGINEAWRYDPNRLKPLIDIISTNYQGK